MVHLKTLLLHNNQIRFLPKEINCLSSLETLDISSNKIRELFITGIKAKKRNICYTLQDINASINRISRVSIRDLTELNSLNIRQNSLLNFPGIFHCPNIEVINLSGNLLSGVILIQKGNSGI